LHGASRRDLLLMLAVGLAALVARLAYLLSYSHTIYWDALVMDPANHLELAKAMARGAGGGPYPYFRAPLYLWILAGLAEVFKEPLWPVRIFQVLMGSATAAMTYLLGSRLLKRPAALLAGLVMALFWVPVYFDGEILITGLATFLNLSLLLAIMRAEEEAQKGDRGSGAGWWAAAGVLAGLSAIARPNILLFAAAVVLLLASRSLRACLRPTFFQGSPQRQAACAGLFVLGAAACILPVTARNFAVSGEVVLISSQGGINFWLGNHKGADGRTVVVPVPRREIPLSFIRSRSDHFWVVEDVWLSSVYVAEGELRGRVGESEVSRYWYGRALGWMAGDPASALELIAKKALYLFQALEVSNNRDLDYHCRQVPALGVLSRLPSAAVWTFILAGLAPALARRREWKWPLIFFLTYGASVAAFFVNSRYRVPLLPVGLCMGALWFQEAAGALRALRAASGGAARLAGLAALAAACALVVNMPWPKWNDRPLRSAMRYNLGIALAEKGDYRAAESELRAALEIKDYYPEAHLLLAKVFEARGEIDSAIAELELCLQQAPDYAPAHYDLFRLYAKKSRGNDRRLQKAMEHLERAHLLDPSTFPPPPDEGAGRGPGG